MFIYLFTLIYFIIFVLLYFRNRTNIFNGILFVGLLGLLALSSTIYANSTNNNIVLLIIVILAGIVLFTLLSSTFWILIITFYSAYMLFRKESKTLANYLSLFLGLFIIAWLFLPTIIHNTIFNYVYFYINTFILYTIFMFTSFIFSSIIYQLYIPFKKIDYIIVLGSGLINGKAVPPLLASRINKAIKLYQHQLKKGFNPKLIMSGGQGSNELVSEAYAMKEYALTQNINEEDIILEDKSVNTYQNMLFSKNIINNPSAKVIFSTNNYHVYRAGIYARKAKLHAMGIGSSTKFYYWFNSIIREFIAVMVMYKNLNIIISIILSFLYIFTIIFYRFNLYEFILNYL